MPSLPQNDLNQEQRQEWLNRKRQDYAYSQTPSLPPLPQIEELPRYEGFSLKYQLRRDEATFKLVLNMIDVIARNAFDPLDNLEEYAEYFPVLSDPSSVKLFDMTSSLPANVLLGLIRW
jgi:arachidonate 15-lipoxygenase